MTQYSPPPPPLKPVYGPRMEAPGATAGLVFGILSLVIGLPIVQLILAWIGFSKSKAAKAMCDKQPHLYSSGGVATAGYVISIIGLVLGCLSLVCGCGYLLMIGLMILGAAAGSGGT